MTVFGVPWWVLAVVVIAAVLGSMAGRSMGQARARRRAAEKMAEAADADHEGARTRHEGGP
jgi:membrane protein YqaA with SNARE-associated domain